MMIANHVCRAPIVWPYLVYRHLAYRKHSYVASWYSQHGWCYVLLLLVYGNGLLIRTTDGVLTISADIGHNSKTSSNTTATAANGNNNNNNANADGSVAVTSLPLSVSALSERPKTDAIIKMPSIALNVADDEFYDDDDSDEDGPLVVGIPGKFI